MLKVYGASDDLIELEGDIEDEFGHYPHDDEPVYLAFSDGTVLKAIYDNDGIWRLNLVCKGNLYQSKEDGSVIDDTNDIVIFDTGIKWVVLGTKFVK